MSPRRSGPAPDTFDPRHPPSPPAGAGAGWKEETVTLSVSTTARLRWYGTQHPDGGAAPWVLHFHGGAFIGGSLDRGAPVAAALAGAGAVVAALDYPLAPAHPFPQAVELGHAVLQWLARHRARRGAALLVAGEEAGGNLAAAVALMARDRAGPALDGQILLSPMLDVCVATASQRGAGAGPSGCVCDAGWRAYLPQPADATHPYATPGSALRLAGLPRSLLLTAGDDPLRDETRAFARRLAAAGVPAALHELRGPTGWPASYAAAGADAPWTDALRERLRSFLHELPISSRSPR